MDDDERSLLLEVAGTLSVMLLLLKKTCGAEAEERSSAAVDRIVTLVTRCSPVAGAAQTNPDADRVGTVLRGLKPWAAMELPSAGSGGKLHLATRRRRVASLPGSRWKPGSRKHPPFASRIPLKAPPTADCRVFLKLCEKSAAGVAACDLEGVRCQRGHTWHA
jgi:hypothetical protein